MCTLRTNCTVICMLLAISVWNRSLLGQEPQPDPLHHTKGGPPSKILVDADILSAFAEKPCEEFCAARDQYLAGDYVKAAGHLRTASAFLQLEAARADIRSRSELEGSIRELTQLARKLENGEVRAFDVLRQAFERAHIALAGHYVFASSLRCCQLETPHKQRDATATGLELRAASTHFEHAAMWRGDEVDEESQRSLDAARRAAEQLIDSGDLAPLTTQNRYRLLTDTQRRIGQLHRTLEKFTGRKIQLARPHEIDPFASTDLR